MRGHGGDGSCGGHVGWFNYKKKQQLERRRALLLFSSFDALPALDAGAPFSGDALVLDEVPSRGDAL